MKKPASQLTALALSISESTVKVIMAAFNKMGDNGLDLCLRFATKPEFMIDKIARKNGHAILTPIFTGAQNVIILSR